MVFQLQQKAIRKVIKHVSSKLKRVYMQRRNIFLKNKFYSESIYSFLQNNNA